MRSWVASADMSTTSTRTSGPPRVFEGDQPIRNGPSPFKFTCWRAAPAIAELAGEEIVVVDGVIAIVGRSLLGLRIVKRPDGDHPVGQRRCRRYAGVRREMCNKRAADHQEFCARGGRRLRRERNNSITADAGRRYVGRFHIFPRRKEAPRWGCGSLMMAMGVAVSVRRRIALLRGRRIGQSPAGRQARA